MGLSPLLKICHTCLTLIKLGTVIIYLNKIQKICKSHKTLLEFSWDQHFSSNINNFCFIKKERYTLSVKNFVGEKLSHFWKTSHFSQTNFSNSSLFPDQFLKLKGLSWVGLLFFQRKVVPLVWHFSNWAWRSALLVSLTMELGVANTFLRRYHKKSFCLS